MKKYLFVFNKTLSPLLLIIITLIGIFFRLENISPFKVYPDSYQSLIVALNIINYHSVLGYLGSNGMVYPDFFSWTHPGYPLIIDAVTIITHNMTLSARSIAFVAGILTIPLAYFFIKRVFSSNACGLAGSLFIACSFNHTVWGGFLMTETTGVFFTMLFLWYLFTVVKTKNSLFHWRDIILGLLFFLMVITRYEYIILLVPVLFFLLLNKYPLKRSIIFLFIFLLLCVLIVELLFPLPSTFTIIMYQLQAILIRVWILISSFLVLSTAIYFSPRTIKNFAVNYGHVVIVFLFIILLILLRNFFAHEILVDIFSVIGFFLMLKKKETRIIGYFSLIACTCLLSIYYYINPEMERYVTHLLPFLIIPASYGLIKTYKIVSSKSKRQQYIFYGIISFLIFLQAVMTTVGLKSSQDPSWYQISYEDKAAEMTKKYIPNHDYLLITSYPEPYYYHLHISTQSIADTYPYIFIDTVQSNQKILIIEDMGMHDDFPHFTNFLDKNLSKNKIASFWVNKKFQYVATVQEEKYPVVIYKITLKELEAKIKLER